MAKPPRTAVVWLPQGFQANPIRGSSAVLSNWIPTRESECTQIVHPLMSEVGPATKNLPLAKSKFACRFCASVMGVTKAQATPRFKVKLGVTRHVSSTKGRNSFQRRPVVAPKNV